MIGVNSPACRVRIDARFDYARQCMELAIISRAAAGSPRKVQIRDGRAETVGE